jgi:hypothetical protein
MRWPRERFMQVAKDWLIFVGRLWDEGLQVGPDWTDVERFMRSTRGDGAAVGQKTGF